MQLSDFATLAEAQAYEQVTYKKITAGLASQFFGVTGMRNALEANTANTTAVTLTGLPPTTVGALCLTVLDSAKTTGFACDPNTQDGALNRQAADLLVANIPEITAEIVAAFWAKGETRTRPFASKTEYEFQVAKGTIVTKPVSVTVNGDFAYVQTTAPCEKHAPRITTTNGTRITSFYNVDTAGMYVAQIPNEYRGQPLFVDDAYGVM